MIIGIEAQRANIDQKTGVEHYAKQLILNLAKIDSKNQYRLYLRTKPQEWFLKLPENFTIKVMPFPIFWTQLRISLEMLLNPVDALLIPASALPIFHPKNSVVTVHDLAWKFYPQTFTWFNRNFLNWSTGFAARNAKKIIAVSNSTKKDLIKFYNIKEEKVSVVYHGFESLLNTDKVLLPELSETKLPEKFVLFLSTIQPRKNLEGLIDAFESLKQENPQLLHKLVVVGKPGWKFESILEKLKVHKQNIIFLNHVSDTLRLLLMKQADCLVLPSFYEGFGMQILESFAAGLPVLVSNVSSMPEIAQDAAIYFNPHNQEEIKNALKRVLNNPQLQSELRAKGLRRLENFSWEKCAEETLKVIQE